jgi:hypothetical protein
MRLKDNPMTQDRIVAVAEWWRPKARAMARR